MSRVSGRKHTKHPVHVPIVEAGSVLWQSGCNVCRLRHPKQRTIRQG